ncbi:MAG: TonB-system energizer ExbB [Granulosicoccus sp.]
MMELIERYLDIVVFSVLGLMSVLALARAIERGLQYAHLSLEDYDQLESLKLELNRGLPLIATVASNAPYVGLLGTVFGIMVTFNSIGQSGQIDVNTVMIGLALALKATALGLLVAIPSMVFYNILVAKAESLQSRWKIMHHVVEPL